MYTCRVSPTILEILSKAPGNPVLWHLFLAELAAAMRCESGILSIAELGREGGVHPLYRYNVAPKQETPFELNLRKSDSFDARVTQQPYRVFCFDSKRPSFRRDDSGAGPDKFQAPCRFGVSLPLSRRYTHYMALNGSLPATTPELHASVHRLQTLVPPLQNALQKEQWFSLYHQITLLTGKHVTAYVIVDCSLNVLFSDPVFNRIIADMDCVEIRGNRLAFLNKTTEKRVLTLMAGEDCNTVAIKPGPVRSLRHYGHSGTLAGSFICVGVL